MGCYVVDGSFVLAIIPLTDTCTIPDDAKQPVQVKTEQVNNMETKWIMLCLNVPNRIVHTKVTNNVNAVEIK